MSGLFLVSLSFSLSLSLSLPVVRFGVVESSFVAAAVVRRFFSFNQHCRRLFLPSSCARRCLQSASSLPSASSLMGTGTSSADEGRHERRLAMYVKQPSQQTQKRIERALEQRFLRSALRNSSHRRKSIEYSVMSSDLCRTVPSTCRLAI
jgi:hypothetical protein